MTVVSFDDWKKRKDKTAAFTKRGALREDVAKKEESGFDLCVLIAEEQNADDGDIERVRQLNMELSALMNELPHQHAYHYFAAFKAFNAGELDEFAESFDKYLESEKELYKDPAPCDWWIDSFLWVFTPPLENMYGRTAELFLTHWPMCSMGLALQALELSEHEEDENVELELDMLTLAAASDPECYLAFYQSAMIYCDLQLWKTAVPYFEKAACSALYSSDAAFYFDYAWAAEKAGDNTLAMQMYQSVLVLDEGYPCAMNNLGCIYLKQGDFEEAYKQFNHAISLKLDGGLPYKNMVVALEKQGRFAECVDYIMQNLAPLGGIYGLEAARLQEALEKKQTPAVNDPAALAENDDAALVKRLIENPIERSCEEGEEVFGRRLRVYSGKLGYGRCVGIAGAGRIDLLCTDESNTLYVIKVCGGTTNELAVSRLARQLQAVRETAGAWQRVTGIICVQEDAAHIKALCAGMGLKDVEAYQVRLELEKL